jgi:hypothetical protein
MRREAKPKDVVPHIINLKDFGVDVLVPGIDIDRGSASGHVRMTAAQSRPIPTVLDIAR